MEIDSKWIKKRLSEEVAICRELEQPAKGAVAVLKDARMENSAIELDSLALLHMQIIALLRGAMRRDKISVRMLADRLGVTYIHVYHVLEGIPRSRVPSLGTLLKFALALGYEWDINLVRKKAKIV